jgi:ubiquinone/menaquinone biosynthesis C-methylase UbiE
MSAPGAIPPYGWGLPVADPEAAKACCAAGYASDAVSLLLGPAYHPGGAELTRRLARALGLGPGSRVLDVASGQGTTGLLLAREFGCTVHGIDLGARQVEQATTAAAREGLDGRVEFSVADAEDLTFEDGSFDAAVCECALCTFPDKAQAAAEFARVLAPGGRLGITDVTLRGGLPASLQDRASWIACIADARSPQDYCGLLTAAGLAVERFEDHSHTLARMLERIEARLAVAEMAAPALLDAAGVDPTAVRAYLAAVEAEIDAGTIGYCLITARRPATPTSGETRP